MHYYIMDFSDIRKPRIMSMGFAHRFKAKEVAQAYFKPGSYKIRLGYQIERTESFKAGKFLLWWDLSYKIMPNNILDKKHRRRTRKQREANEKRRNRIKLESRAWLMRCLAGDLGMFLSLLRDNFTMDIPELKSVQGSQALIETLQKKSGPEDWNRLNYVDYIITLNILRVLVIYDYDNGPFSRYHIAAQVWKVFSREVRETLDGEEIFK